MAGSSSARPAIWMAVLFLGKQACQYPPPPTGGMESTSISLDVGALQNLAEDIAPQLAKLLSGASPEFELKLKLKTKPGGDLSEIIALMQKADPNWKI